MTTILIVEDDPNLRLALRDNLEDEGYTVHEAADLAGADRAMARWPNVDLVVLDIMLPDGDGYSWCRRFRRSGGRSAVLMLTARTLEGDLITGLDAGADDYLTKPYRLGELFARVRALLRRAPRSTPTEGLGRHRIDRAGREVRDERGRPVQLTRTEFDLLMLLLDRCGEALSRDHILDAVWGVDVVVDPRTVDNFISNLKKKLGWSRGAGWRIETVRGIGYRLVVGT